MKQPPLMHGFLPVYDEKTEILILGTAPSVISLERKAYYANRGNQFWTLVFASLSVPDPIAYEERIKKLKQHRIGLWDVYASFERKGSLDTNFSKVVPNDFTNFLPKTNIRKVIANGTLAYQEAQKIESLQHLPIHLALSTSGANNGRAKERAKNWQELLKKA